MTNTEFEKAWAGDGFPIFRHPEHGVLIAGQGELCGNDGDTDYIGFWTPIDCKVEAPAPYFLRDDQTTEEMENYEDWDGVNVEDLEYTGKRYTK